MNKLTKAQSDKLILETVKAVLVDGKNWDDLAGDLVGKGAIDVKQALNFHSKLESIGKAQGWILTLDQIKAKVIDQVKVNPIGHFLDVVSLARSINLGNKTMQEKKEFIVQFCGVEASTIKESAQMKRIHSDSTDYGKVYAWVAEHPDFKPADLHKSGILPKVKMREGFFEETIAAQVFYFDLYERNHSLGIYKEGDSK